MDINEIERVAIQAGFGPITHKRQSPGSMKSDLPVRSVIGSVTPLGVMLVSFANAVIDKAATTNRTTHGHCLMWNIAHSAWVNRDLGHAKSKPYARVFTHEEGLKFVRENNIFKNPPIYAMVACDEKGITTKG